MHSVNCEKEEFELVETCNQICLFTDSRIDRASARAGLFIYELREDDYGQGIPCSVEPQVVVNFGGTLLTRKPIEMTVKPGTGQPYRNLIRGVMPPPPDEDDGDNDAYFEWLEAIDEDLCRTGYEITVDEFQMLSDEALEKLFNKIMEEEEE